MSGTKLRVLALVHRHLIPPDVVPEGADLLSVPWRTEYDGISTLRAIGHEERALGVHDDPGDVLRGAVVECADKLRGRVAFVLEGVGTAAIVERYVEGRELYVGLFGNQVLQSLPVCELFSTNMPAEAKRIATDRVKWSVKYQKKYGIDSGGAKDLSEQTSAHVQHVCKRAYRALELSGFARIDLRLDEGGRV